MAALAAGMGGAAYADCLPNPPGSAAAPTVCSGNTTGGVTASTSATITVNPGATLTAGASDTAAVVVTSVGPSYWTSTVALNVSGRIDGASTAGVVVRNDTTTPYYNQTTLNILVDSAGVIEGATAIRLDGATGLNYYGGTVASVDNSGVVRSTSGAALVASLADRAGFSSVNNRVGGYIGGIQGSVQTLTNAGVIDGGAGSAYSFGYGSYPFYSGLLTNTGEMRASGSVATLAGGSYLSVVNSGLIVNTGTGVAIKAEGLGLENQVGGVIQGAGTTAIDVSGSSQPVRIVNRGTINGTVRTGDYAYDGSTVDNVGGVINGDLLFGSSNDVLIGALGDGAVDFGKVTGRIDGGGGANVLRFLVSSDQTVGDLLNTIVPPTNFQNYQLSFSNGAKLTLEGDIPDGLTISGVGGVVNNGTVQTTGTAFGVYYTYDMDLSFANNGDITALLDTPPSSGPYFSAAYAVSLRDLSDFSNTGTITAVNGNGVLASLNYGSDSFVNSGEITATGYALNLSGAFVNDGTLRSTAGEAVYLSLGGGVVRSRTSINNGLIEGVTAGAEVSAVTFVNTGTITASNGVGVNPSYYSTIDNRAGGVISGTVASIGNGSGYSYGYNAIVLNAGTLNGDVNLASPSSYDTSTDVYVDNGGLLNGSLRLGGGDDYFVADTERVTSAGFTGVTGTVDGGEGRDTLMLRVSSDTTRTLDSVAGFEGLALAVANNAVVKLTTTQALASTLAMSGTGSLDLTADVAVSDTTLLSMYGPATDPTQGFVYNSSNSTLSVISRGALSVTQTASYLWTAGVQVTSGSTFENAGTLTVNGQDGSYYQPVAISGGGEITNSGVITLTNATGVAEAARFVNSGQLLQAPGVGAAIGVRNVASIDNSGTISTGGAAITYGTWSWTDAPVTIDNSGTINSGTTAIQVDYAATKITNATDALIRSGADAGAAIRTGYDADTVRNDGTIIGLIDLGAGDDKVENYGAITGNVALGDGNDTFVQWVSGRMTGVVDGGFGLDTLTIDSTGGGSVTGGQFVNFERFTQIGGGSITYSGAFTAATLRLEGGTANVAAGTTVKSAGSTTFTGGEDGEQLINDGTIAGGVVLGGGVDTIVNRGTIGGSVRLGSGDDSYTEGAGAVVNGAIDGGAGVDTFITELAGDRTGLRARAGFERLGVTGTGKLTLALDQNWEAVNLAGVGLDLSLSGFTAGGVFGGDTAEAVSSDGDVATVSLGGGDDSLTLGGGAFAGVKDGGSGVDALAFTTAGVVTVTGAVSGFETVSLAGGRLDVSGSLGATGDTIAFGDGDQTLSILAGGQLSGTVDLGAGADVLQLAAGGQLIGAVLGGAGDDVAAIDLTSDLTLRGEQLQQFETLQVTGTGALNFTGAAKFDHLVTSSQTLTVDAGSSLESGALQLDAAANTMIVAGAFSGQLNLGGGDDVLRLTPGGTFTGSADGGAGNDRFELALGGTDAAPIALGATPFAGFETLSLQSGVVSLAGDYGFDRIEVANGRLIGLAGSRLTAGDITVASGATFGSAGTVVGDIAVAGTLSPGASPGTMTVTGDVALAAGSTALFELTPTVSDKLVVSGVVTIAPGATLKLVGERPLTPGRTLDLIVADGGISGTFSTIDGAQTLSLHIKQSANRLQALGLFTTDTAFSSNVSGVIGALNTALIDEKASASLIAAMPSLVVAATGKSDPAALARITPQAYASASQLGAENGLTIVEATRAQARFAPDTPGLFGFGQAMTNQRKLDGDAAAGVNKGKVDSSGVLTGVGFGTNAGWVGAFVGYLDGRERIGDLGARTDVDGFVFGVQGQVRLRSFELGATLAHDGTDADTQRALPGSPAATSSYKLKTWVGDVNLGYRAKLNGDWTVRPRVGASYVRTQRDGVSEQGGGAFGLAVQGDKATHWFADGQVELLGGQAAGQRLHPYVSAGFRTVIDGGDSTATATFDGVEPLTATGLGRDGTVATVGAGLGYDLRPGLILSATYAGEFGDGGRQGALVGLRWKF